MNNREYVAIERLEQLVQAIRTELARLDDLPQIKKNLEMAESFILGIKFSIVEGNG